MRERMDLDFQWRFMKGDLPPENETSGWGGAKAKAFSFGAAASDFDDSGWQEVDIPHDFVLNSDFTIKQENFLGEGNIPAMDTIDNRHISSGSLEGNIGWYRKRINIPKSYKDKRIYLYFDGIYRDSIVFLNEFDVGRHTSGYTSFFYDITDFINYGGKNLLAIRVDAKGREGWWYEGGGIYRHVYLEAVDNVHVAPWGTYITSALEKQGTDYTRANISIQTTLINRNIAGEAIELESAVLSGEGKCICSDRRSVHINPWDDIIDVQSIEIGSPVLWCLENPYLYGVRSNIYRDGVLIDSMYTKFGIRDMVFDAQEGFFLNGKSIMIKGVCCHQDHAGVGIGVPDKLWKYRLDKIKELGANAYRCSHHPPAPELLDLCDRMGILVIDETRKLNSSPDNLEQIRTMVKRDRNHPSVIMWSIGNEEISVQDQEAGGRLVRTAQMEVKLLDKTRPVTMAFCGWNGEYFHDPKVFLPASKELDIMGFNYMPEGWNEYHTVMPDQPIIITEAAANSSTRGSYRTDNALNRYFVMDPHNTGQFYKAGIAETQWKQAAETDFISGIFLWTGFDYRGEPTPFSYPAVYSQFGIFDACGFPKDNYYYYKSWWGSEKVLHIFPHWNWPDKIGEPVTVYCYSNADEVELFVNGKSQGKKKMERNLYLEWPDVIYEPGELSAKGYFSDHSPLDTQIRTSLPPAYIGLKPEESMICADGKDVCIVSVEIHDSNGDIVPDADFLVHFQINGAGELLGTGNGNPQSHESDKVPFRRTFHGLCQLLVKSTGYSGTIEITAASEGLAQGRCIINVK